MAARQRNRDRQFSAKEGQGELAVVSVTRPTLQVHGYDNYSFVLSFGEFSLQQEGRYRYSFCLGVVVRVLLAWLRRCRCR